MTQSSLLSVEGVTRVHPGRGPWWRRGPRVEALADVSIDVAAKEVVAVLGLSGAGKSTLARIAAGLDSPSAGRVLYEGAPVPDARARARFVQLVFQEAGAALDPLLSVRACIEEPLRVRGILPRDAAAELLAKVGLGAELLTAGAQALSGGQKQRVQIARALALSPRLLVLDEPLAALDTLTAAGVRALLEGLRAERGLGLLWVTHDVRAARGFADRVVVLHEGRVVESGPAARLDAPEHPATRALVEAAPAAPPAAPPVGAGAVRG